MRVFVTGAGGFVGSAVIRTLVAARHEVVALRGPDDPVSTAPASVREEVADIREQAVLRRLADGADLVVHAAGPPSVRRSFEAPVEYAAVHVAGTAAVAEACACQGVRRLVHISSAEVYGTHASSPVNERAPLLPASPYAAAKVGAEAFTRALARRAPCTVVVLRPFSIYGPGQSSSSVLGTIIGHVAAHRPVVLHDLRPVRDYVWINDVASAVLLAGFVTLNEPWRAFNVASGRGASVQEVASFVKDAWPSDLPIVANSAGARPANVDPQVLFGDPTRADRELGFRAGVPLRDGIRLLVQATRQALDLHQPS
jgi:UDP-glucose 4-epimerase